MRNYDLSPLYRSTVGFDRLFSLIDQVAGVENAAPSYPPYNIEKVSDAEYRVTLAVAGFAEDELSIESRENSLVVRGQKAQEPAKDGAQFLFQGIAARAFERRFQLADYVSVTGAKLENGLLHVELVREVPEAKRARSIPISNGRMPSQAISTGAVLAA